MRKGALLSVRARHWPHVLHSVPNTTGGRRSTYALRAAFAGLALLRELSLSTNNLTAIAADTFVDLGPTLRVRTTHARLKLINVSSKTA